MAEMFGVLTRCTLAPATGEPKASVTVPVISCAQVDTADSKAILITIYLRFIRFRFKFVFLLFITIRDSVPVRISC